MFVDDLQSILTSKLTHERKSGLQRTTILRTPAIPLNKLALIFKEHRMMSKIYAALVSTFTASEIYAQDSVQR